MSSRYQAAILSASFNGLKAPDAPTIGTATAGAGSASVAFTAPANVGGGAITGYTVISSPGSIIGTGASSPITVSGLTNGTAYTFTVVATNAYGTGPASAASNSVTPAVNYIENVFSTYLYTGTGASQTITNGIDLSTKGGLVWIKSRSNATSHALFDTVRGATKFLTTNTTNSEDTISDTLTAFNTTGFTLGSDALDGKVNTSPRTYVGWTFRKQEKFFDIVTYTGNGTTNRTVAHNLGSRPGLIAIKRTDATSNWYTAARIDDDTAAVKNETLGDNFGLNLTDKADLGGWDTVANTTTINLNMGGLASASTTTTNINGATYVAYLWAHNAGGFGVNGTDNVISCGSWSGTGSPVTVNLGYEPQFVMCKTTNSVDSPWLMYDSMRGMSQTSTEYLQANVADVAGSADLFTPTSTGFINKTFLSATYNWIYIAIRRGPMATPTVGTSVFSSITNSATTGTVNTTGFPVDMGIVRWRDGVDSNYARSRLQGVSSTTTEGGAFLKTNATDAESTSGGVTRLWNNTGFQTTSGFSGYSTVYWNFGRAPGFFDEVCYTGNGTTQNVTHNLGVVPELMMVKRRNATGAWGVYTATTGASALLQLESTAAVQTGAPQWNDIAPTSSVFSLGTSSTGNTSGGTYVWYGFATLAGVSKVGSYTGTGALQTINCAFTTGARFVLIKRTDSTGDWWTYDSARGITSGNDPYLFLNSTAAEVTGTNYVDTTGVGFQVTAAAPAALNAVGGTYIFLAIA